MLRNFIFDVNNRAEELQSTAPGVLSLETECTYDGKISELVAKLSGLQLPDDPGPYNGSLTKAQLKMNFTSAHGVKAYHFISDGSYQSGGNDEYWSDATPTSSLSLDLLKFLQIEQDTDTYPSYIYQSPIDSEQYWSGYISAIVDGKSLYKRIRLRVKSQGQGP
jgi:hypothetical protein